MTNPRISISDDYAVLRAGQFEFYYGYEYGRNDNGEVWGFRAKKNGQVVLEYAIETGKFDVTGRLLEGIGNYLRGLP
jgi:hypothetical protein